MGYVLPAGARGYLEADNRFADHGIELRYHSYRHIEYHQLYCGFMRNLWVLDLLSNERASRLSFIRSCRIPV